MSKKTCLEYYNLALMNELHLLKSLAFILVKAYYKSLKGGKEFKSIPALLGITESLKDFKSSKKALLAEWKQTIGFAEENEPVDNIHINPTEL